MTLAQVRESFATPETVPFWQLPFYIDLAERAGLGAAGYRLQYQQLLSRPFLLTAMVMLAASVSLRFFRFGGVQKMVLGGNLIRLSAVCIVKVHGGYEQIGTHVAGHGGLDSGTGRQSNWLRCAVAPGGRLVASSFHPSGSGVRGSVRTSVAILAALVAFAICSLLAPAPVSAQSMLRFPERPAAPKPPATAPDAPMLVQANEIRYDYTNNSVAAVGNVQLYYNGATVEADEVIYDQKTKRLQARGNVRMTEADGKITYGQFIDLT